MGIPIVIATNGYGTPVTEVTAYGLPVEIATNGYGTPVVIVASGGLPVIGSGGGTSAYAPESETIFAAFTTPPTTARKNLIDAAVVALKAAGVWTKLDALYAFAAADSQAAKINWVAPGTYNCTEVNAPSFTTDSGFSGVATAHIDTSFNPTTAPTPKYTLNDASAFGWSLSAAHVGSGDGMLGSSTTRIFPYFSGNSTSKINGSDKNDAVGTGLGLHSVIRVSSANITKYHNSTLLNTHADTSSSIPNVTMKFLAAGWLGNCAGGGFGLQLSGADVTALHNALRTYLTGVGVP